jgi:hypothetical protein
MLRVKYICKYLNKAGVPKKYILMFFFFLRSGVCVGVIWGVLNEDMVYKWYKGLTVLFFFSSGRGIGMGAGSLLNHQ